MLKTFDIAIFDLTEFIVWNIYGLEQLVPKIKWIENQSLWQRLNSFVLTGHYEQTDKSLNFSLDSKNDNWS